MNIKGVAMMRHMFDLQTSVMLLVVCIIAFVVPLIAAFLYRRR